MLEEQPQERVGVGFLQIGEDRRIRGVAGLGFACLWEPELFEQHLLQLLRRPEVDFAADRGERVGGDRISTGAQLSGEPREGVVRNRDPVQLHVDERIERR